MGGGDDGAKARQSAIAEREVSIAEDQNRRSGQLWNLTFPGMQKAVDWYSTLASGDPDAIWRSIAPATEQINQATTSAKENIRQNNPRGGESRLAEEIADVSAAGQKGRLATQSYTGAFPALASLGGQGIGLSINQVANALAGMSGAGKIFGDVAAEDAAGKSGTMGFLGSMMETGGTLAAMACWIAEALWGDNDERTHLVRHWLNVYWEHQSWVGRFVMPLYRRHGRAAAARIRRYPALRILIRPLFELALFRARLAVPEVSYGEA